jgi:hypothetical protein
MMEFTELERQIMEEFRGGDGLLKSVLEKFCEIKAEECRRACVQAMAHVPREPEVAADYAAKVLVYETFVEELLEA